MTRYYIGLDIGKTKVAAGVVSENGRVVSERSIPSKIELGGDSIIERSIELVKMVYESSSFEVSAIGIGASGVVDFNSGVIVSSGSIPNYSDLEITKIYEQHFGVPCFVENDVYAAAIGEYLFGAAKGFETVVFVIIGTGVGIAIVSGHEVWHGEHNLSGQIAHIPLCDENTVNSFFSGKGLELKGRSTLGSDISTKGIFDLSLQGNAAACQIISDAEKSAAIAISWIQQIVDPGVFVFGGSISVEQPKFIDAIIRQANGNISRYSKNMPNGIQYRITNLEKDVGIIGAAALAHNCTKR